MPTRIRVAFCHYGGNAISGPASWLVRMLPRLRALDIDPFVIRYATGDEPSLATQRLADSGIDTYEIQARGLAIEVGVQQVLQLLAERAPNVVVADHVLPVMLAAYWTRPAGMPMILTVRSDDDWYRRLRSEFLIGNPQCRMHGVVAVSDELANDVASMSPDDIATMQCPSSVPIPQDTAQWDDDTFHLVYVGRLESRQKRILDLTRALIEASISRPRLKVTLYGDGPQRDAVCALLAARRGHRVSYGGRLDSDRVIPALTLAQAMVLYSAYEGLSTALQEAMACGLPVISRRMRSGIAGIVEHLQTGYLLDDDAQLGAAIDRLSADRNDWQRIATNARRLAADRFAIDNAGRRWRDFLHRLATRRRPDEIRVPDIPEIATRLAAHCMAYASVNADEARLLAGFATHWPEPLQRFVHCETHAWTHRWSCIQQGFERKILRGDALRRLCIDDTLHIRLRSWIIREAVDRGLLGEHLACEMFADASVDWQLRRWTLYRLYEQAQLSPTTVRDAAAQLLEEWQEEDTAALYQRASLLELAGSHDAAVIAFEAVLDRLDGGDFRAGCHYHLARIALAREHVGDAGAHLRRCLALCPTHQAARSLLDTTRQASPVL